jgi:RNA polymerase sigma factor (TIGR02999 family)
VVTEPASQVTRLLEQAGQGNETAAEDLLPLVYTELKKVAQVQMNGERTDHTLSATALVHEAYLRLVGNHELTWDGKGHFFVAAAEAMRRVLIEHARARRRIKRGGGQERRRLPHDVIELAKSADSSEITSVDDAIHRLAEQDPRMAEVVRLRFYAGLSEEMTARVLGVSDRTVRRDWTVARAWLHRAMFDESD